MAGDTGPRPHRIDEMANRHKHRDGNQQRAARIVATPNDGLKVSGGFPIPNAVHWRGSRSSFPRTRSFGFHLSRSARFRIWSAAWLGARHGGPQ